MFSCKFPGCPDYKQEEDCKKMAPACAWDNKTTPPSCAKNSIPPTPPPAKPMPLQKCPDALEGNVFEAHGTDSKITIEFTSKQGFFCKLAAGFGMDCKKAIYTIDPPPSGFVISPMIWMQKDGDHTTNLDLAISFIDFKWEGLVALLRRQRRWEHRHLSRPRDRPG